MPPDEPMHPAAHTPALGQSTTDAPEFAAHDLSPYPRRGPIFYIRALLLFVGPGTILVYLSIIVSSRDKLAHQGISVLPQFFSGLGVWSYAINWAVLLLLLVGCIWAIRDMVLEDVWESRVSAARWREPPWERAEEDARKSLARHREIQDRQGEAKDLSQLSWALFNQRRYDEAESQYRQSLQLHRERRDREPEGRDLFQLAEIAARTGDLDRAEALYRESLAISRKLEDSQSIADQCRILGKFLITGQEQRAEGCQMLAEALQLYREQHDRFYEREVQELVQELGCKEP